jgi:heme-degrading monooxygenase HmoA
MAPDKVTSDSHPPKDLQVIEQRLDESEIGESKALAITEVSPSPGATFSTPGRVGFSLHAEGLAEYDMFESITNPGKMLLLTSWKTAEDSARWTPSSFGGVAELRHRRVRNVRDYGMFERREAAQYYPDVNPQPDGVVTATLALGALDTR